MAWAVTGTMAAMGAYSAYSGAQAANKAADTANENAKRRYMLESGVALNQMEEQNSLAMQQMTEVGRAYMKAKGEMISAQADSGVAGNVRQRIANVTNTKFSEARGKVASEIDTNVINIAQGMLASKVDTEAIMAEANAKRKNVFTDTLIGAISGGVQGYSAGKAIGLGDKAITTPPPLTSEFNIPNAQTVANPIDLNNSITQPMDFNKSAYGGMYGPATGYSGSGTAGLKPSAYKRYR